MLEKLKCKRRKREFDKLMRNYFKGKVDVDKLIAKVPGLEECGIYEIGFKSMVRYNMSEITNRLKKMRGVGAPARSEYFKKIFEISD